MRPDQLTLHEAPKTNHNNQKNLNGLTVEKQRHSMPSKVEWSKTLSFTSFQVLSF